MKSIRGMVAILLGLALALTSFGLTGCASLQGFFAKPEGTATAKVVVQVAVFNLITDKPEYKAPVLDIIKDVRTYIDGDPEARVDTIMVFVDQKIPWNKLSPQDALAIQSVLTLIEVNLYEKVQDKTLSPDLVLKVKTVIDWIETVAKTAGPVVPKPTPSSTGAVSSVLPNTPLSDAPGLAYRSILLDGSLLAGQDDAHAFRQPSMVMNC